MAKAVLSFQNIVIVQFYNLDNGQSPKEQFYTKILVPNLLRKLHYGTVFGAVVLEFSWLELSAQLPLLGMIRVEC
jgi:hypothetical protein